MKSDWYALTAVFILVAIVMSWVWLISGGNL
jgi:hypothetical protein